MIKAIDETRLVEDVAKEYFQFGGYHCSESVVKAFNEVYGLKLNKASIQMATGLAGGIGKAKCACGSITGGVLILSALYGRTEAHQDESLIFDLSKELHDKFFEKHNSACCKILTQHIKWGHPDHVEQCSEYVYTAAKITRELIEETEKNITGKKTGKKKPVTKKSN